MTASRAAANIISVDPRSTEYSSSHLPGFFSPFQTFSEGSFPDEMNDHETNPTGLGLRSVWRVRLKCPTLAGKLCSCLTFGFLSFFI